MMSRRTIWDYYSTTSSGSSTNEPTGGWDFSNTDWTVSKYPPHPISSVIRLSRAQHRRLLGELPKAKVGEMIWI